MDKPAHNVHASDHQLAEIVQGMNEACFALDSQWRFTFVNDRCQTLLHHRRDEMLGRPIWELFHRLAGTPVEAQCRRAMAERVAVSYETFSPIAERWIDVRVFPSGDGLAVFLLDIHERKLAEQALHDASRLNRQIISGAREGIIVYGNDLRYQVWNPFMEELTGYSASEVIGRHPMEVFPFLKDAGVMDQLERVLAGESCAIREFPFQVSRSGRSGWASDTNSPLRNGNGRIIGVIGIVTDITERKRLEREILGISECEQSRLGQDLHDGIGQELAGIAMLCKVLADELHQESHPSARIATDISTYVNNTIGSARRLARGLYPIELSRYGLFVALRELAESTGSRLGIRCEMCQTGVAPEFAESVGIHIYRIVQECIGNAIKHGHASHILIESLAGDGFHTFTVTDNGVGFEKPVENGGMGLHLMEYRARVIGAKITVEKPEQGGCQVTCTVPV